eukprot:snap_masked-scaffold715_size107919-processed-gene-0.5 protein:Tk04583 transcript:snap_masked-scaffold715_size107919-processed-gene-0.5-mRNA-1 annotation:"putative ferroportin"
MLSWKVYIAHSLSTWGDNMWWFAGGLYMMELAPENLRLTATYGLIISATVICLGATLGRWIDKSHRLTAARSCLVIQNVSVAICALVLSLYLSQTHPKEWMRIVAIVTVIGFSAVAKLASTGNVIILQKDWIVVITGNDTHQLANMNSVLRTIELTTYMLAPAMAGQLFTFVGYVWTGVVIAGWNVGSVCFEYTLLELIYKDHPELAAKMTNVVSTIVVDEEAQNTKKAAGSKLTDIWKHSAEAWRFYFEHPVRNAGLGLALLYMTVLGFDNITYGYVVTQNIPESVLGILVGGSAFIGVLGSIAYPHIKKKIGLERTGLLGMLLLVFTSSLSVVSLFLPGSPFLDLINLEPLGKVGEWTQYQSVCTLLMGIIAARFGLWIADLTITQIIQERVEEQNRGTFNGVQDALNNSLDLIKCVLVILLPKPEQFGILVLLSYASISLGWLCYALYSRKQRGHLFHFCHLVQHFSHGEDNLGKDGKDNGTVPKVASSEEIEELENML